MEELSTKHRSLKTRFPPEGMQQGGALNPATGKVYHNRGAGNYRTLIRNLQQLLCVTGLLAGHEKSPQGWAF